MWGLPGAGFKSLYPALADRFLTTGPSGKSNKVFFFFFAKIFIEFTTILFLFYALVFWPQGMWDLSSPTRDRTACIGSEVFTTGPPGKSPNKIF